MKICLAQTRSAKGDVESNIEHHQQIIRRAIDHEGDIIIFPELSITNYEPELAQELAVHLDDHRFDDFQEIADNQQVTIGIGVPLKADGGICISLMIFHPHWPRQIYSKKYLHSDEEPFFVPGNNSTNFLENSPNIALGICYELSVPAHAEGAFKSGAEIYLTSVAKSASGVEKASERLSEIAKKFSMLTLMVNNIGPSDNFIGAGQSAMWNRQGDLIGQLDDQHEGLLLIDLETYEITKESLESGETIYQANGEFYFLNL